METYLALLRGINVGGKNKISMADLAAIFVEVGCVAPRTYIQSGNVIFEAAPETAVLVPAAVSTAIATHFGFQSPVVSRTASEIDAVVRDVPFPVDGVDETTLHVSFLAATPTADRVAALDPQKFAPDLFVVHGRTIYLQLPQGMARTKLTNAYFDRALATISTVRNWRTVIALRALMEH